MSPQHQPNDTKEAIARDIAAISRIGAVSSILRIICKNTGLGFAAVARVTDNTWTACAVQDGIQFGLQVGGQLDVKTTLCLKAKQTLQPVVIDHASQDPVYCDHHTPRLYNIESYISVPIRLPSGEYFGNLCAIDPRPALISDEQTLTMFTLFAELIGLQLENERRQLETESALLDERQTADLREQFIAVLGHDLRNPLAAVGATAELLTRKTAAPELVKMGTRLRTATLRMSHLIDDVMDFARGRLGDGIDVSRLPVDDLATALHDVVTELRDAHPDRIVLDHIAIACRIHCDQARMQQLLSNLLGNALAHGAQHTPIEVHATVDDDTLVLSVSNGGDPIAPENLERVFEPYWRPANSKPGGGLGLGLYICSQIAKAHGGNIQVNSSAADGTCFTARLPLRGG
jgi:signal transduction histidine kinase